MPCVDDCTVKAVSYDIDCTVNAVSSDLKYNHVGGLWMQQENTLFEGAGLVPVGGFVGKIWRPWMGPVHITWCKCGLICTKVILQRLSCDIDLIEQCTLKTVSCDVYLRTVYSKGCVLWCRFNRTAYCKGCVLWCRFNRTMYSKGCVLWCGFNRRVYKACVLWCATNLWFSCRLRTVWKHLESYWWGVNATKVSSLKGWARCLWGLLVVGP